MPRKQEQTGVSEAFQKIKEVLPNFDDLPRDTKEDIYNTLATLWSRTQRETREEVAERLERLSEGRMEYVGKVPTTVTEIEALPNFHKVIYGEASGARWLARIIRGDSDKGWLPSWRWS